MYRALVESVLLYACETCALRKEDERRLDSFHHSCLRRILKVPFEEHRTNSDIRSAAGIKLATSDLVKRRRLKYLGHVLRMKDTRLPKITLMDVALREWKRPPCAPLLSWRRQVHKETRPLTDVIRHHRGCHKDWDVGGVEWLRYMAETAVDRGQWQEAVAMLVPGLDNTDWT